METTNGTTTTITGVHNPQNDLTPNATTTRNRPVPAAYFTLAHRASTAVVNQEALTLCFDVMDLDE